MKDGGVRSGSRGAESDIENGDLARCQGGRAEAGDREIFVIADDRQAGKWRRAGVFEDEGVGEAGRC